MKIVSFGDVHMATRNLARMHDVMRDTDLVIVSGDLTNFGDSGDAAKVIREVRGACGRVLALPGNLDTADVIPYLEREGVAQARERLFDPFALEADDRDGTGRMEGPRGAGDPGHHRLTRDGVEQLDRLRLQARSLPGREQQHRERRP